MGGAEGLQPNGLQSQKSWGKKQRKKKEKWHKQTEEIKKMKIYIFNAYEMILPSSSHDDFMMLHHTTTVIQVDFPS